MNLSLRTMSYFVAAAHNESLSKAAQAVGVSQSAISVAIDAMEEELGLRLFHRQRSKGVFLTASGRDALVRIQAILDQVDNFKAEMSGRNEDISGELHVACFSPIAPIVLTPIMKSFVQAYPTVRINILEGNVRHVFDSVHRGEADVGISYDEADISAGLSHELLAVVPPHVVVPVDHAFARLDRVSLDQLASKPLILLDLPSSREYYSSLFETAGINPNFVYRSGNYEMVRSLVGAGLGFALLQSRPPEQMTYSGARVVCKPLAEDTRKSKLMIAYSAHSEKRHAVMTFVAYARKRFKTSEAQHIIVA